MSYATLQAIVTLKRGEPLPVDLYIQLTDEGVNVSALERRYGA